MYDPLLQTSSDVPMVLMLAYVFPPFYGICPCWYESSISPNIGAYRKTSTRLCRLLRCNTQVLKKNKHVLANSFIVFIDRTPVFWFTAHLRFADSGQNGTQDFFPKDHQRSDGADSFWWNQVSSGIGHFGQEVLGTQFFQVVRRSASIVGGIGRASHRLDGGGELPSVNPSRRTRQRQSRSQDGPRSGLVDVDAADSGLADLRWMRKFIESAHRL